MRRLAHTINGNERGANCSSPTDRVPLQGVGLPCLCASSNVDPMTPMYRMISRVGRDMHILERKNTETMMRQNRQCVEW